jgi:hypothetical protein
LRAPPVFFFLVAPLRLPFAAAPLLVLLAARPAAMRRPVALGLTLPSAISLSFLSAAFSSLSVAFSRLTTLS